MRKEITISLKSAMMLLSAIDSEYKPTDVPCCACTTTSSGFVFCRRPRGHKGDHRGSGIQWDDK